jgi:hypothetical protein
VEVLLVEFMTERDRETKTEQERMQYLSSSSCASAVKGEVQNGFAHNS